MPINPGNYAPEIEKLASAGVWVWLIDANITDSDVAYLTTNNESVTYNGQTYQPFPVAIPTFSADQTLDAARVEVTIPDPDQELTRRLKAGEIKGQTIAFRLCHLDLLSESPLLSFSGEVVATKRSFRKGIITLVVGSQNFLLRQMGRRWRRLRCDRVYKGPICLYRGSLTSCDYTLTGANGCEVHGADEASRGVKVYHPQQFGGAPGIPKENRG